MGVIDDTKSDAGIKLKLQEKAFKDYKVYLTKFISKRKKLLLTFGLKRLTMKASANINVVRIIY